MEDKTSAQNKTVLLISTDKETSDLGHPAEKVLGQGPGRCILCNEAEETGDLLIHCPLTKEI